MVKFFIALVLCFIGLTLTGITTLRMGISCWFNELRISTMSCRWVVLANGGDLVLGFTTRIGFIILFLSIKRIISSIRWCYLNVA